MKVQRNGGEDKGIKTKMIEADEISIKGLDKMTEGFSYETFSFQAEWVEKGEVD